VHERLYNDLSGALVDMLFNASDLRKVGELNREEQRAARGKWGLLCPRSP